MLRKIIHAIMLRRHFWRHATFSEIAELYMSRMLRIMALNMTAAFTSIYLFQNGYSVVFIALLWMAFYLYKVFIALPMAAIVARIGAKHSILAANLLYIPGLVALALLPQYGTICLAIMVFFQATSSALYQIGFLVDFSKVKSTDHAGKEIAYMNILEKVTMGLSPLLGGLLALFAGPQVVLVTAAILFGIAAVPLFRTAEQELPRQKLRFKGFPWRLVRPNVAAESAIGFDVFTSGTVWTLFVAITIIGVSGSNDVYAMNGILSSVVLI
jgi:MFS family permease